MCWPLELSSLEDVETLAKKAEVEWRGPDTSEATRQYL